MKKKLTSFALALAMCLTLTLPAFATQTGKLTSSLESMLPELAMTMPDSAMIILNPYRMATSAEGTGIDSGDRFQIMNAVFSIVSATTAKVHVDATVTGVAKGATFVASPVAPGDTNKNVYLTLTHAISQSNTASIPVANDTASNVVKISDSAAPLEWDLPAATKLGSDTTVTPQRIDMQFGGSCSDSPSESPWTNKDTVSCSFVFTVKPITDIPMVATTYQLPATGGTLPNLTFTTFVPTNPAPHATAATAAYKVESASVDGTALTVAATDTWDGTTVTLTPTALDGKLGTAGATAGSTKLVKVTLSYMDGASSPEKHEVEYEAKVTVLAAPASP